MDYKTIFLKGKEFRYYNDDRIDYESHNVKGNWRTIAICDKGIYKRIDFMVKGKQHSVLLHRIIYFVNNPDWNIDDVTKIIDHINHKKDVPLDNSITNLRCVTNQQNQFNRNGLGCSWYEKKKKWKAQIRVNKKLIHLGYFVEKQDAEDAYQKAKIVYHKIII
jgi:hypothetical protein